VGALLTVSCTQSWACTGAGSQTITETNTDCSTAELTTCVSPQFCSTGQSVCLSPNPSFNGAATTTGHLQILPNLVKKGDTTKVHWNVSNVLSCTVSGNNDSWSGLSSGSSGKITSPIMQQAIYTLLCLKLPDGSSSFSETQTVDIIPGFQER
jgi:hypothetical protein